MATTSTTMNSNSRQIFEPYSNASIIWTSWKSATSWKNLITTSNSQSKFLSKKCSYPTVSLSRKNLITKKRWTWPKNKRTKYWSSLSWSCTRNLHSWRRRTKIWPRRMIATSRRCRNWSTWTKSFSKENTVRARSWRIRTFIDYC